MEKQEKLTITINPDTGEYRMDITYASISHIKSTLLDIVRRIDGGEFHRKDLAYKQDSEGLKEVNLDTEEDDCEDDFLISFYN